MAFKDENGRITIDETAAQNDINNIDAASERLRDARASILEIKSQSLSFSGKTATGICEASDFLIQKYDNLIEMLDEEKTLISQTVNKYEQIDAELSRVISGGI